jgi:hypothetical protein
MSGRAGRASREAGEPRRTADGGAHQPHGWLGPPYTSPPDQNLPLTPHTAYLRTLIRSHEPAMRCTVLLLILSALASTGCSMFIAKAGKDLSPLESREDARAQFGEPIATGTDGESPFEEFRSRQKLSEPARASTHGMGIAMTFFLFELYLFPRELCFLTKRTLFGQTIRVIYSPDGRIERMKIDDFPVWFGKKPSRSE